MKYLHVEGCGVWLHHHVMLDLVLFDAANEKEKERIGTQRGGGEE